MEEPRAVVVTGVSTGVGHALVRTLLDRQYHVYGSVRNQKDANRLSEEFGKSFTPLLFDVRDEKAVAAAAAEVKACIVLRLGHASCNTVTLLIIG